MLVDYVYALKAKDDVAEIVDFLLEESHRAAELFLTRLDAGLQRIRTHVHIGPAAFETRIPGMRRMSLSPYVMYYLVHADQAQIVRVLHGARNVNESEFENHP